MKELNILIDGNTNVQLCDFGLAYRFKDETDTLTACCGTPGYWSPEQVKKEPYRMMPDWWTLGVIVYRMMEKKGPWDPVGENWKNKDANGADIIEKDIFKKKLNEEKNRRILEEEPHKFIAPKYSDNLKDLVLKLLTKDPKERLGAKNDGDEILEHPVFPKELIAKAKVGDYDAPIKPQIYDFTQDFNDVKKKQTIAKALDCFVDADRDLIASKPEAFTDPCFGKTAAD
tara:strand:- start:179 stop:865 length:687 start_codon:yes stop_codon:yes gene_type:complete